MSGDADIIKQFLVSLGFQIDEVGLGKFKKTLKGTSATALTAGKAIVGIGTAAQAMVLAFSSSMEKLYFQSKRTDTTVANLQALEFGSKKIGLAAGQARELLEGMAANLRMNPGLLGLLQNFGIKTEGRQGAEVMLELVQKLASMPHYVGARFADMFGVDEKSFLMLKQGLPELLKGMDERKDLNKSVGLDPEAAAAASHEYMNLWRNITEKMSTIGLKWSVEVLPYARKFAELIDHALDRLAKVKVGEDIREFVDGLKTLVEVKNGPPGTAKKVIAANADKNLAGWNSMFGTHLTNPYAQGHTQTWSGKIKPLASRATTAAQNAATFFAGLEKKYGLPPGLLDRMWSQESARGKHMRSPKGAKGHFGFMDDTAAEYGVKDPDDLNQSADGAGHYMHDLMSRYGGNVQSALAAYNFGIGKFDRAGGLGGKLPRETRDYVGAISGRPITIKQETTIRVDGAGNPAAVADQVAGQQTRVNGDLVRNLQGAVQ